jgi:hypothetical protein
MAREYAIKAARKSQFWGRLLTQLSLDRGEYASAHRFISSMPVTLG